MEELLKEILSVLLEIRNSCNENLILTQKIYKRGQKMGNPIDLKKQIKQATAMFEGTPFENILKQAMPEKENK
jgi:hypothetical protein